MPFLQEYTMLDELGKGGFATVYKVRHNELGYIRAVRVLNETIVDAGSKTYQKFLRECKVLLRLGNGNHPNIVHIYQPRLLDNKALVEMDYVDGQDIMHYLKQEKNFVPVEEVIRMALQMSSALAYCHEDIYRFCMDRDLDNLQDNPNDGSKVLMDDTTRQRLINKYKVIHNDIHSGNIMRREDGNFVLLDFGLAINGDEVVRSSRHANGAPEFKAPEKWDDESILTEQSDIYSFGVVMFEYLAGRVPFPYDKKISNKTEAEYLLNKAHKNVLPPPIEDLRRVVFERNNEGKKYTKDYPQWLEDVILKCLQKDPTERFKNGKELFAAISAGIAQMSSSEGDALKLTVVRLQKENDQLQQQLQEKENEVQKVQKVQNELKIQVASLETEKNRLLRELEKTTTPKWKVCCFVMIFLLAACGSGLWYVVSRNAPNFTAELERCHQDIGNLQLENAQLNDSINCLQKDMKMRTDKRVKSLETKLETITRQYDELNSAYNNLKISATYQGKTAEQWYVNYKKSYNNGLYNGHNAQYWYKKYMGY